MYGGVNRMCSHDLPVRHTDDYAHCSMYGAYWSVERNFGG